ncbi:MAG TPA: MBL fold metallo-hydrolase, partial [Candidatus Binatia bacterium]
MMEDQTKTNASGRIALTSDASLRCISGLGGKYPACFLVETTQRRLLVDLGYGPNPGLLPNVDDVGRIDALLLSHGHRDHAGGLSLLPKIGNPPIYATEFVRRSLPSDLTVAILPLHGTTEVLGIRIQTGRSGHAPGGIWIHFSIGAGLLYMGDHSTESILYAYDPPPPADNLILDASYAMDDVPVAERWRKFDRFCSSAGVLLPVPGDGRGPEIALYLARQGCNSLRFDAAIRSAALQLINEGRASLRDGVTGELTRIAQTAGTIDGSSHGVMLTSRADATAGESARLIEKWEHAAHPEIVFTGYVPPGTPAERLIKSGRASYLRWNVHPRLSENIDLVRRTGARVVIPAFCEPSEIA